MSKVNILQRALEMYQAKVFMGTHPEQIYDYERHHKLTKSNFEKWWWEQCYCEARILWQESNGATNEYCSLPRGF